MEVNNGAGQGQGGEEKGRAGEDVGRGFEFEGVRAPVDEEGYVMSFPVDEAEGQRAFFDTYGFVVVRDVLSPQEIEATVDEIWTELKHLDSLRKFDGDRMLSREDPSTWDPWPSMRAGILGNDVAAGPQAWYNRQNPRIHQVFTNLFGTEKLIASVDRYGVMRPTKGVKFIRTTQNDAGEAITEEVVEDRPDWRTMEQWFHWDLAVWAWCGLAPCPEPQDAQEEYESWLRSPAMRLITENNGKVEFNGRDKMQGLVTLSDSTENDGGFETVPCFHKFLSTWAKQTPIYNKGSFVPVPEEDPLRNFSQKITARRGSLIIWSSRMPHCNYPNSSPHFRYVQYIKMFPEDVMPPPDSRLWQIRAEILRWKLPKDFEPSDLGRKLFGLKPWSGWPAHLPDASWL